MCSPVIHWTGFIPHPSPAVTPSPLGRLPFGKLGYPSFVFFGFAEKSTFPSGEAFFVGADNIRPVFDWTGLTIPQSHLRCDSSLYTREPYPLGRLFAADRCFYSINRLWVDKAKKRLFMRKNGMTDDFCERIFIHFLYIFLINAENPV